MHGKGYWKLNTAYLRSDSDFCTYIRGEINEFKEIHKNSELNPQTLCGMHSSVQWLAIVLSIVAERRKKKKKERSKMFNLLVYAQAQKMSWVCKLLDDNYTSTWKVNELKMLSLFNEDQLVLFKAHAPDCVLNKLKNSQLIETIKIRHIYRQEIIKELGVSQYHLQEYIWWNKNVRLKHKSYFFYPSWYERGIHYISHFAQWLWLCWFDVSGDVTEDIFMSIIVNNFKKQKKIPNMHMLH